MSTNRLQYSPFKPNLKTAEVFAWGDPEYNLFDQLNEKYMKLYTDYEELKKEKETSNESGSKYYEPKKTAGAPFDEITIVSPTGEVIKYSTEKEKFEILEQLQINHDNTVVENEDGSMTISAGRSDVDELINQYWILSGWGPYNAN